MLTNFLNNWILDKNVKFDFKKKDYVFPLFDSSLSFFKDDFLKDDNDKTISSVDIVEDDNNKPSIYFINLRFLDFDSFIDILTNELKVVIKEEDEYNWNYEKSNQLYILLFNNLNKVDKIEFSKVSKFINLLNTKKEYNNKFVILNKGNTKLYEFYNLYFINKSEIEKLMNSELFDNIIDQITKIIDSINLSPEVYLSIHNILFCKIYKLLVLEISKDKDKQNFKENVINPLIMWLFGEDITKIKDNVNTKEFENKLKERLTSLLFDYNNKSVIEDTIIFNDLIIVNDSKKEIKTYEYQLSNYKYCNSNTYIKSNDGQFKNAVIMLNVY